MPQISPAEFYAVPLRVHTLLADVPLHDIWAVDVPGHRDGVTLSEFLRRATQGGTNRLPQDALATSFGNRLTPEDRARSFVVPGTPEGLS